MLAAIDFHPIPSMAIFPCIYSIRGVAIVFQFPNEWKKLSFFSLFVSFCLFFLSLSHSGIRGVAWQFMWGRERERERGPIVFRRGRNINIGFLTALANLLDSKWPSYTGGLHAYTFGGPKIICPLPLFSTFSLSTRANCIDTPFHCSARKSTTLSRPVCGGK